VVFVPAKGKIFPRLTLAGIPDRIMVNRRTLPGDRVRTYDGELGYGSATLDALGFNYRQAANHRLASERVPFL
jgi:hypothetical protein